MILPAFGLIALICVGGFMMWDQHQVCMAQIEGSLRKYHATDIQIKRDWFQTDHHTSTYDVEYRDRSGDHHRNRCKVDARGDSDEAVYWVNPIGQLPSTTR